MALPISEPVAREDGPDKCAGAALYLADLARPDALRGVILRSDRPRARILSVSVPPLPSGYAVFGAEDFPVSSRARMLNDDWPFLAEDTVNHVGEPILLLVGPDPVFLRNLRKEIRVSYEDLPPVLSIEEAERGEQVIVGSDNRFVSYRIGRGDPAAAFQGAARIVTETFRTGYQEHIYMEPQAVMADFTDGRLSILGSMQCPYYVKNALTESFGLPEDRVRIVQTVTGGAFGGKEEYPTILAGIAAVGAFRTGRPVKLVLDRAEDIATTTKRHPSRTTIRTAVDARGRIRAMEIAIVLDGGAYEGLSSVVLQRALFAATGVYDIPAVSVTGEVVATNRVPTGAFRGFGAPQAFFAIETHMNNLAVALGIDPLEFKKAHAQTQGCPTLTSGTVHEEPPVDALIAQLGEISGFRDRKARGGVLVEGRLRGLGFSLFKHGCGFTGSGERDKIKAVVRLRKTAEDTVVILVSSTEMGQGAHTTLRKVAAEALGLPLDRVQCPLPDTDAVPDSGPTVASRTAMIVGELVLRAASALKAAWKPGTEEIVEERYRQPEGIEWDQESFTGDAYPTYSWGANCAEVAVDPLTGEIEVTGFWGAYDIGTPLDRRIAVGQMTGGIAQGIGYATIEVMDAPAGRILQASMTDYAIPTSLDLPPLSVSLVETPGECGPFGAKGAGELPLVGAAPAVAAAVSDAIGRPVNSIPIRPEDICQCQGQEERACSCHSS